MTRGTTRIDKPTFPTKCFSALSTLPLNACHVCPYLQTAFETSAPECSLRYFPQAALSVGDAAFLSLFITRVSFFAFHYCIHVFLHFLFCYTITAFWELQDTISIFFATFRSSTPCHVRTSTFSFLCSSAKNPAKRSI